MNVLDNDYESFPAHTRIPDEEILAVYVELTVNGEYALLPYEEDWRERGPLISASGYQLRRRYDMDWAPSWEDTNLNPFYCEDSIDSSTPNVMDAIRLSDGLPVAIKATLGWTTEANIAFLFTDGGAVEEARNHCVPILDTFIDEDIVYIVMPLLRPFNDPPFLAVAEVIDFIDQLVEGIEYMHQQNVAHRDITIGNIMMDASELYPEGFHPVRQNLSRNGMAEVVGVMRTHAPVRYYLIDFDSAIAFEKGTPNRYKYAEGKAGRDDEVPEFKLGEPHDPFKVDIFQFGNLLKKEFLQKYTGVEFLEPLVREMTRPRPGERPSATSLRVRFNTVRNRLSPTQMRTHLNLKDATDPFREHLLQLGIESLLDSDLDDSPEQSSSEAPTTGNSNRSHDSYWSAVQSMESSITSQSSIEQPAKGPLNMITDMFSRSRSPSRPSSNTPQEAKGTNIPWKPAKPREPSPPPARTAPQSIGSAKDQVERDDSPERSGLKTGRFPWSPSSSPDSVGSPILAVINQFLRPDTSHKYGDVFDNDFDRRPTFSDDRLGREQAFTSPQYQVPQKSSTPAAAPVRNRRNTVNAASAPAPAPVPTKAAPTTNRRGRGPMSPMFDESAAPAEYAFFGGQSTRPTAYGKQNKSSNVLPTISSFNNSGWNAQASNEQAQGGYFDMPQYDQYQQYGQYQANEDEDTMWAAEEVAEYVAQSPPPKPVVSKLVEKKEQVVEKKAKTSKSPFSTLSKKSAPSEPIISTTTTSTSTSRNVLSNKSLFGANTSNRKSFAVEDATPFNTPPRTTVNLPSPTTTSPVSTKPKKTRTKKGSISEAPKEKEGVTMKDNEFSIPPIQDDFSASKTRRRGSSGASATSRPTSPMAMFLGSRAAGSNSKKEASSKPSATKPSSFKSSAFQWAAKAKPSPPVETDWNTDTFSHGASDFSSLGWKNKADESTSMALVRSPATSPNEGGNSDYDMGSEPVSTPPTKSGWKTKASTTSYFPSWDSKQPANSPKEEEDDLAHLLAQMTYPTNAEATPKAPLPFDFSENVPSFQFNSSAADQDGDDYWSGKFSKAARTTTAKAEPAKPIEETFTFPKKASKSKVEAVPEVVPESKVIVTKGKNKKGAAKTITKPTIAVESPQPTPTTEAEEWSYPSAPKVEPVTAKPASAWSFGATTGQKAVKVEPTPAKVEPAAVPKSNDGFGDWFGYSDDAEVNELDEETALSTEETKPEVEDSWFSVKQAGANKTSKAAVTPPVTSKAEEEEQADEWWSAPVKGKKGKNTRGSEPVKAPTTNAAASRLGSLEVEGDEPKEKEDLSAELAASLGDEESTKVPEPEPTPVAAVEKEKPAAKVNVAKGAANKKKKGKR